METLNLTLEQVINLLPTTTSLVYVDYRDNLDEQTELIQQCISEGTFDRLYEKVDDWYMDANWEGLDYYLKELKSDIENTFDIEDATDIMEQYEEEIRDEIYNRCDDDIVNDLLRNTSNLIAHYDTGYEMDSGSWNWSEAETRLERIKIKKFLGIKNSGYNDAIDMMIGQATYGGSLLIYFQIDDLKDFFDLENVKSIKFKNAHIGIIDHFNGSGDITDLPKHQFTLPFNKDNVFLEKSIKYNWTYAIAGMVHNWCESTEYIFADDEVGTIEKSTTNNLLEQEQKYNETYKNGSCSVGDMDIKRHRNTTYINNYPCGNKCKDCGTFWID